MAVHHQAHCPYLTDSIEHAHARDRDCQTIIHARRLSPRQRRPHLGIVPPLPLLLLRRAHLLAAHLRRPQQRPTRQADGMGRGPAEDAQTDAAHEADVDHPAMAEAGGAEVDADLGRAHQQGARRRRGHEAEHQRLQHALRVREREVGARGGVAGLLQEGGGQGGDEGEDVDGDGEPLCGEDGVHEGDVLRGRGARCGKVEDAGVEGGLGRCCQGGGGGGVVVRESVVGAKEEGQAVGVC